MREDDEVGQESWFAALIGLPQLSLETTLSLMKRLDEFRENAMLVGYASGPTHEISHSRRRSSEGQETYRNG